MKNRVAAGVSAVDRRSGSAAARLPYADLPAADPAAPLAWLAYPPDQVGYEAFLRRVFDWWTVDARGIEPELGFGPAWRALDVCGAPVAAHTDGRRLPITNAVIDFGSEEEGSEIHAGAVGPLGGGWVDLAPGCGGSVSREVPPITVLQEQPCHVILRRRELSFLSLDLPTSPPRPGDASFRQQVIDPLRALSPLEDHLYGWLDVMFAFCAGKPLVYFSRYVPSNAIHQLAWPYHVRVVHRPLHVIPAQQRELNRAYRLVHLTREQWDALCRKLTDRAAEEAAEDRDPAAPAGAATR